MFEGGVIPVWYHSETKTQRTYSKTVKGKSKDIAEFKNEAATGEAIPKNHKGILARVFVLSVKNRKMTEMKKILV